MRKAGLALVALALAGSAAVGVTNLVSAGAGVFSIQCGASHQLPDDPIVSPNDPGASHLHEFYGNTTTNAASTYSVMILAGTTCRLSADTAGYWAPALVAPDGSVVEAIRFTAYYRGEGDLTAFPPDFRMIVGHPNVQTGTDKKVGWSCNDTDPFEATPPNCTGYGSGFVKAHLIFPQCWDGVHIDSPDHRSHVVYKEGGCPASHPVELPRLNINATYPVSDGRGYGLSSDEQFGVADGRSLHADFWNTWNQDALEVLVNACLVGGRDCKELTDQDLAQIIGGPIPSPAPSPSPSPTPSPTPTPTPSPTPSPSPPASDLLARVETLEAQVGALLDDMAALEARVAELERRVPMSP